VLFAFKFEAGMTNDIELVVVALFNKWEFSCLCCCSFGERILLEEAEDGEAVNDDEEEDEEDVEVGL
jgi:hypothetical protein